VEQSKIGFLLVISGASGAGKDTIMAELLKHPSVKELNLKKIITCTDRLPRPGETHGVDYHFVTREKLLEMEQNGELVEKITLTGSSNKATPKSELMRLLNGEDLVWRIDPSRAAEIASEGFFIKHFPEHAHILQKSTVILCVTAPKNAIEQRRRARDGENYVTSEYRDRDKQELPHLHILQEKAVVIDNPDGCLKKTVDYAANLIKLNYEKAKSEKN